MAGVFRLEGHAVRLQSLRGIAALSVAVGHAFTLMSNGRIEDAHFSLRPGNAFLAAGELLVQPNTAVIAFYVLSGFVLGEALRRQDAGGALRSFGAFAARRLWRLLPVMWLSILIAAAVALLVRHAPFSGTTVWFNQFLSVVISPATLLQNLLGFSYSINTVLWSIQIELVMIVLLPPMVWLVGRTSMIVDGWIIAALCIIALALWGVVPNFVMFAYCFYLGVILPKLLSNPTATRWLGNGYGLLAALALLLPVEYLYVSNRLWMPYKFLIDTLVSGYVIAFILLRTDSRCARILDRPVLVWIGDVSYSFYCYAMPVLIVIAWTLMMIVPASFAVSDLGATVIVITCIILCVAISLILAQISFTRVESPCIATGRVWSRRIAFGGWSEARSRPVQP
jgi:peptidoglycan/LPS O-acetylase OafA/YrhL